jgi:hypothetical protein
MVPRGGRPEIDPLETRIVVGYLIGLASITAVASGAPATMALRISDPDLCIGVDVVDGLVVVTPDRTPPGAAVVEGRAADVVDRLTGRAGGTVAGDPPGLEVLDRFALVLAT